MGEVIDINKNKKSGEKHPAYEQVAKEIGEDFLADVRDVFEKAITDTFK